MCKAQQGRPLLGESQIYIRVIQRLEHLLHLDSTLECDIHSCSQTGELSSINTHTEHSNGGAPLTGRFCPCRTVCKSIRAAAGRSSCLQSPAAAIHHDGFCIRTVCHIAVTALLAPTHQRGRELIKIKRARAIFIGQLKKSLHSQARKRDYQRQHGSSHLSHPAVYQVYCR